jgi:hypothetical protein
MQRLREAAIGAIDQQKQTRLYFAEWSLPSVDPNDEINWGYANPALGQTIPSRHFKQLRKLQIVQRSSALT